MVLDYCTVYHRRPSFSTEIIYNSSLWCTPVMRSGRPRLYSTDVPRVPHAVGGRPYSRAWLRGRHPEACCQIRFHTLVATCCSNVPPPYILSRYDCRRPSTRDLVYRLWPPHRPCGQPRGTRDGPVPWATCSESAGPAARYLHGGSVPGRKADPDGSRRSGRRAGSTYGPSAAATCPRRLLPATPSLESAGSWDGGSAKYERPDQAPGSDASR